MPLCLCRNLYHCLRERGKPGRKSVDENGDDYEARNSQSSSSSVNEANGPCPRSRLHRKRIEDEDEDENDE